MTDRRKKSKRPERETDIRPEKRRKVLAAAYDLLTESGVRGVKVEHVARRSRIAKTTVYRYWPSREALLAELCGHLPTRIPLPNTGAITTDIDQFAIATMDRLQESWASAIPSIIEAAELNGELAGIKAELHDQLFGPFLTLIEHAQKRGELSPLRKAHQIVTSILGPLLYRRFVSREPLDEAFARNIVQTALAGMQ